MIVGALTSGWSADRYGRLVVLLFSNGLMTILAIGAFFSSDIVSFIVLQFCLGTARQVRSSHLVANNLSCFIKPTKAKQHSQVVYNCAYVLLMEWMSTDFRSKCAVLLHCFWILGLLVSAGLGYAIANWRYVQLVIAFANVTCILYIWYLIS